MNQRLDVSCVLPAFNEAAILAETVERATAALRELAGDFEVIVVDDGSTDGTADVLAALAPRYPNLRVVRHERNRGYGASLRSGFAQAASPWVFFTDADLQFDPQDLRLLLAHTGDADLVAGYRQRRQDPWLRRTASRGYRWLVAWSVGASLRDLNCAFKLIRKDTLARLALECDDFCINAELGATAAAAGVAIREVGIPHHPRRTGESSIRVRHVWQTAFGLMRLRGRLRRRSAAEVAAVESSQRVA